MQKENQILLELLNGVDNWADLKPRLEQFNTSQTETTTKKTLAGKVFEVFAKYYFQTEPKKTELYQNVWLYDDVPLEIKEQLRLPSVDHGIDLLLQDYEKRFYAVQCKFKNDETKSLSWSGDKIANVFALGTNCDKVIVFTNVSDITQVAKSFEQKFELIAFDELISIEPDIFENIFLLAKGNQPKELEKYAPQPHQEIAITNVLQHFESNERGQLILPCGAGKSLTSLWIKEEINPETTLVLVPSLALLKQIKNDWSRHKNDHFKYICVCSEKDIDKDQQDAVNVHTYEIGGPVTTDPFEVQTFLKKSGNKVIYSTYQSIGVISDACKLINGFQISLVICDEAHRTAGSKNKNTFTLVHDNSKIPAQKRLYMTATPKVVSTKLKSRLGEDYELLCDMSNPDVYGTEAFRMSFGQAIDEGILVDYKIIGIGVTDKQIKKFIEDRNYIGEISIDELAHNFALDLVMNKYQAFHAISFHSKVKFAQEFALRHKKFFETVFSESVNGKQSTTYRARVLRDFKNSDVGLVTNARCLTEGVDVPTIDLIYFCDPKTSKIDIVQASGRALRTNKAKNKELGFIVVPIFHHIDEDVEKEIKKKPIFDHLIQVIRSLCDQDERLQAEINDIAFKKGKKSNSKIQIDFSDNETEKIIKLEGLEKKVKDVLFDEIIEKTRVFWDVMFKQLLEYKKAYGHTNVSRRQEGLTQLGNWILEQRRQYHNGKINSDKRKKLEEIGFDWKGENRREITDLNEIWKEGYSKLEEYFNKNGNSNVPARYEEDKSLGTWVVSQRVKYDNEKLADWQINLLEKIKFDWDPKNKFDEYYRQLILFKQENGHLRVPTQGDGKFKALGKWVNKLRVLYNTGEPNESGDIVVPKKGRIRSYQLQKLNEIGFVWNAGKGDWNTRYRELEKFYHTNGHSYVKQSEDASLFYWCYKQRKNKEKLDTDQINKLNKLEFSYEIGERNDEEEFLEKVIELQEFQNITGGFVFYKDFPEFNSLKIWLAGIRKKYRAGQLEQDKIDFLESVGFSEIDFSPIDKKWNDKLLEFKEFHDTFKTYAVPNTPEYKNLRLWLKYQIKAFTDNKLEDEKIEQLNTIGFNFNPELIQIKKGGSGPRLDIWHNRISELKKYFQKHKTWHIASTDEENRSLMLWLRRIKKEYGKGILPQERIDDLVKIGFDFNLKERAFNKDSFKKRSESIWKSRLKELSAYYSKNKTFFISTDDSQNNSLLQWMRGVRKKFQDGKLEKNKYDELKRIGLDLSVKLSKNKKGEIDPRWLSMYEAFKKHYQTNQTFHIDSSDKSKAKLLNWIRTQRVLFNKEELNQDKLNLLLSIGYSFTEKLYEVKRKKAIKKGFEDKWQSNFKEFKSYFEENNTFLIPQNDRGRKTLRSWIQTQRSLYRKGELPEHRIKLLESIGYDFALNFIGKTSTQRKRTVKVKLPSDNWDTKYLQVLEFKMKNGHTDITRQNSFTLANWLSKQRADRKANILEDEKIKKLDFLEIEWELKSIQKNSSHWDSKYNELKEVFTNSGSSFVSTKDNKTLASWIIQQRVRRKKGKLSNKQIELLNEINFDWEPETKGGLPDDEQWFSNFQQLEQYKEKFGHCNVSQVDKVYKKLGRWLNDQRVNYSRGKILEHRKDLLEQLGVIWNVKEHEWNSKLQMLKDFYQKYGHFDVKQNDKEFGGLYNWLFRIKKNGTSTERKNKLEEIGFDTNDIQTNENN